ncbi:MAG TPA: MXAN_5808 family serine peptidase [Myxococcales bacterium]|nr:MXAN_5808 family serine peptidase [Myxococcales bacterium]
MSAHFRRAFAPALVALATFLGPVRARGAAAPSAPLAQDDLEGVQDSQPDNDDLSTLKILNQVVLLVKDNYVDPRRIHPKEMMNAALDYVQRTVADVLIDGDPASGHVTVTVGSATKDFDVSDVDTLWKLSFRLKDIFSFMQAHLSKNDKPKEIEDAAVAGMLSTLDPHSVYLPTEAYKEMKLQTRGEFGGLGFVISMKDSHLLVMHVLPGTPAAKAHIKKDDWVMRIEEQSTVNMDLNDAVSKLRGAPGSPVHIVVARKSWPEPKPLTLTREIIQIESVTSKLLETKGADGRPMYVGGIKIKNFQGNTSRDLRKAIDDLQEAAHQKGGTLGGIVLDLRGDPGGLLEQAIQVTNTFVDHGTIVTTVGLSDKLREPKKARPGDAIEKDIPLAVLVDNGSASASEIVSGALKNLDRAVIVGRPTFGKGSVQVLYDFADQTALKLTIAQYLTPGDISIQEVGIVPDIRLDRSLVSKDRVDVFAPKKLVGEADLEHHFGNPADVKPVTTREEVVEKEKPEEIVRYLGETPKAKPADDADADPADSDDDADDVDEEDDFKVDFQVEFARDLIAAAPVATRSGMLAASKGYVDQVKQAQEQKIDRAIAALGVDGTAGSAEGAPKPVVEVKTEPLRGEAGGTLDMTMAVTNDGTGPLHQLRAYTDCPDNPWLDRREFLLGLVKPGETKSWTVPVKIPKYEMSRRDEVTFHFQEENGLAPPDQKAEITMVQLPKPAFAFSWEASTVHGPADGMAHVGQDFVITVDVKNEGTGKALSSFASLKNLGDEKIFIKKGREKIGALKPGETHPVTFELSLVKGYAGGPLPLRVSIVDDQLDEVAQEKIEIPVAPASLHVQPLHAAVRLEQSGPVFLTAAQAGSPAIASGRKGQILPVTARAGGFWAVPWGKDRTVFLPVDDARETRAHPTAVSLTEVMQHEPPRIQIAGVDASQGGPVTDGDHFELDATATDPRPLRDGYVFVNDKKVLFQTAAPGSKDLHFDKSLPLKAGNNRITVIAREDDDYESQRTFNVMRRSTEVAARKTDHPDSR